MGYDPSAVPNYDRILRASGPPGGGATKRGIQILDSLVDRLPAVEDLVFWILENAFVLAYVGSFELVFHTGPGLVYSALAVLVALFYILMARWRYVQRTEWVVSVSMVLPVLVLLGSFVVTGGLTAFSVLIDVSSILLSYFAYKEHRRKTLMAAKGSA